ncbi:MAG: alpha-1,4-glucan--maltose-1-phosphate maltosyltransferase, partial [Sphingomonas taxi]
MERLQRLAVDRVAIEGVEPEIDGGRFAVKRAEGEPLTVTADIFSDGHEIIAAALLTRGVEDAQWRETPFAFIANDRWGATVRFDKPGPYRFTILAWRDTFATWASDTRKKKDAGVDIALEMREGAILLDKAAQSGRGTKEQQKALKSLRDRIARLAAKGDGAGVYAAFEEEATIALLRDVGVREDLSSYGKEVPVWVDRERAAFSSWYELMPRSQSGDVNRHGTFDDVIARLPDIREMGFDVLYFPPIHPIGKSNRKGKNNSVTAQEGEPGSPYAIGSAEGGHKDLHPQLGSFADFQRLVTRAADHGLEIAIDFAIQCSPDHPWIKQHPEWFDWRPDGSIKYAENPPKKYQDIVNVDFYREGAIPSLWQELLGVVLF